ncbi:hypothetical protein NQL31_006614 [Lotmaria passim]
MQVLPNILSDRRQRLQVHETTVVQDATRRMSVAVQQLIACVAQLQQSSSMIEGSVLVLGVPTTHTLLTQLNSSTAAIQSVADAWRTTAAAQQEHISQSRRLINSMDQAYNAMRERRDAAERELRTLRCDRDRKDAAFDKAVDYVQRVVIEHTKWQEAYGYNTQQWPVVEACEEAMRALHHARISPAGETSVKPRSTEAELDGGGLRVPITARAAFGVSRMFPSLPLREWAAVSTDSSEDKSDVAQRWSATVASWQTSTKPSVCFAYVPPAEEVRLLRDVLAMGTGSTTLMRDIQDEQARLVAGRAAVRAECAKSIATLHSMRSELARMKQYVMDLVEGRGSFMPMSADLLHRLQTCIEAEVAKRLVSAPESLYHTARATPTDLSPQ